MERDWKRKRKKELQSKFRCAACCLCLVTIGPAIGLLADRTGTQANAETVVEAQSESHESIIRWKQPSDEEEEEPEVTIVQHAFYEMTPEDIELEEYYDSLEELAICVEAEAGNQDLEGKRLVVDVILNRVDDKDWPNTIKEVIEEPIQFSSFWDGGMEKVYEPSEETFKSVRMELEERSYPGIYYFTAGGYGEYGTPWRKVGDHYFCTK